ncbi:MAG: sulfite oxidase [Gemmataceae bacterium]|nr:sulfite oxidase [Gemmataceae bacterium]
MIEQRKIVTAEPENSETPLDQVRSWVTPNRLFFVRNHFEMPHLDSDTWQLLIEGCVERPRAWTWDELAALPERSVFATMECAGNGRSFLHPLPHGVPWGAGAIGHAEWTGVPLRLVLQQAGLRPEALEVVFEGHDTGTESDHPARMAFARSLPIDKALDPDTLLVTRMNGELLTPEHGYPVRLLVPGWYGVASVKWLRRIDVTDRPFRGYYQTVKYTVQRRTPEETETVVVGPMALKSEVIRPHAGEVLGLGTNRLFGVAWGGPEALARVEVSTDGGSTWADAELIGPKAPYSWTMWEYLWEVARPGEHTFAARAVSVSGAVQPAEHEALNGGYLIHHYRPRSVRVAASRRIQDRPADVSLLQYDMNAFAEENRRFPLDVDLQFVGGEGI